MPSISTEPCTFALFGALGDLALRKLFPALYQLDRAGLLHENTRILALARESGTAQEHLANIEEHLRKYVSDAQLEPEHVQRFVARLSYVHVDFLRPEDYHTLAEVVGDSELMIAYFATPAAVYGAICENLARAGLVERTRAVLEKPIGHSLESSRRVNAAVAQFFPENRVYRIDHYLGKEMVQNLMVLRSGRGGGQRHRGGDTRGVRSPPPTSYPTPPRADSGTGSSVPSGTGTTWRAWC